MNLNDIKKVGVAGGGTMGFGIAINFALWGYPVVVYDLNEDILKNSRRRIKKGVQIFIDEGLISAERARLVLKHIALTTDFNKLTKADFITEAIIERLVDKQELFNNLDELCPPHTILASNTSRFLMSDIGKNVKRQDKIVLTHYFVPAHIVPGVEVAKGPGTSDETIDVTFELMKKCRKVPVKSIKEIPGHMLSTIQGAMAKAALRCWAEGIASAEDIELGIKACFGFRSFYDGPFGHRDLSGTWRWPADVMKGTADRMIAGDPSLSEEAKKRIRERFSNGYPVWFLDPNKFEEEEELRDREYARRLKDLYWGKVH